jgi:hypothetical protein
LSVLYRGDKTTLSVTVAGRRLGKASSVPAQRAGRPVGGIGDEAWILNSGRTIVARAGGQTVKLTLSGRNSRDRLHLLPSLAALAAHRLAARNS